MLQQYRPRTGARRSRDKLLGVSGIRETRAFGRNAARKARTFAAYDRVFAVGAPQEQIIKIGRIEKGDPVSYASERNIFSRGNRFRFFLFPKGAQ